MAVSFVCDLCGAAGLAPGPGSAQCATCGHVALVLPADGGARRREVAAGTLGAAARPDPAGDEVDLVLDRELEEPQRLAELWTRPETRELPTPIPQPVARARRHARRGALPRLGRGAILAAIFASGAAFAVGAAVAFRGTSTADAAADAAGAPGRSSAATSGGQGSARAPISGARTRAASTAGAPAPVPARSAPPSPPVEHAASRPPSRGAPATTAATAATAAEGAAGDDRGTGFLDPAPEDRQCVPRALRALRREQPGRFPEEITVRFPVAASGAVGSIDVSGGFADAGAADAIREAVRGCPFRPGADGSGRPTAAAVVMRIRFPR
jgi:hypothetical protein